MNQYPGSNNLSGWYAELPPRGQANQLQHDASFDWVVVGAGFAGVAAARRLAQLAPNARIALIEAQRLGWGSSGRNSGFMIDLPHNLNSESYTGAMDGDRKLIRLNRAAIAYAKETVTENNIHCDWSEQGKLHGAANERGENALNDFMRNLDALDEPFTRLNSKQMQKKTGIEFYRSGVHTPGTVLIQPAAYIRGCAQTLPDNVTVFEDTEVQEISTQSPFILKTGKANIKADQVLLTSNGYLQQLGYLQGKLLTVCTYASITRPLTDSELDRLGGELSWGLIPANPMGTTLRKLGNKRLLIRNTFTYNPEHVASRGQLKQARINHKQAFFARFGHLGDIPFEHTWGGVLCLSQNNQAFFGKLSPGLHAAVCQNGLGLARGTIAGKLLAESALGESSVLLDDIQSESGPSRLPPKVALKIAVPAVLKWKQYQAGIE